MAYLKQVGGLTHWRVGRIGGSVYVARPTVETKFIACDRIATATDADLSAIEQPGFFADRVAAIVARHGGAR